MILQLYKYLEEKHLTDLKKAREDFLARTGQNIKKLAEYLEYSCSPLSPEEEKGIRKLEEDYRKMCEEVGINIIERGEMERNIIQLQNAIRGLN